MKRTSKKTIQEVAQEMLDNFESKTRENGKQFYCNKVIIEWQKDIIHKAHGDMLPDDYRYQFIHDTLEALENCEAGNEEDTISEMEADYYTSELTEWLNSRNGRVFYLSEALEELAPKDGFQTLTYAQYKEIQEVANLVLEGIKDYIDSL